MALIITLVLSAAAMFQLFEPAVESGRLYVSLKWQVVFLLGVAGIFLEILVLAVTWTKLQAKLTGVIAAIVDYLSQIGSFNLVLYFFILAILPLLLVGPYGRYSELSAVRLLLFWISILTGALLLRGWNLYRNNTSLRTWWELVAASMLFATLSFRLGAFISNISTYPFTLTWSETSRYYYASLYFANRIYNDVLPLSPLHPSRYLLQSIPFLIPNSPLWSHRAWQVFLWIATTLGTSAVVAYRISITDRFRRLLFILWMFLVILIGPVFYHLQIIIILVIAGFHRPGPQRRNYPVSILVILLASFWAGISRVNWYPVPGVLAACLILLEQPVYRNSNAGSRSPSEQPVTVSNFWKRSFTYLLQLVGWVVFGTAVAFASQSLFIRWSGIPPGDFTTFLSSKLLWYRLLPNPTYPIGILPAILLFSLPFYLLIWHRLSKRDNGLSGWRMVHPIRLLGLVFILLGFLAGGLLVSVKIGGGSNLHNLDAYIIFLLIVTGYFFFNRTMPEGRSFSRSQSLSKIEDNRGEVTTTGFIGKKTGGNNKMRQAIYYTALVTALLIPVYFGFTVPGFQRLLPYKDLVKKSIDTLTQITNEVADQGGDILFITDRHLLTFGYLGSIPLESDYEKVFLMEKSMAGDPGYLNNFHQDLYNQRYQLIVVEPLFTRTKGIGARFGEENDAWVRNVVRHLKCSYKNREILRDVNIQLLVPRNQLQDCPK